jgi:hypothetical protein
MKRQEIMRNAVSGSVGTEKAVAPALLIGRISIGPGLPS